LSTVPVISVIDDDESIRVATKTLVRSLGFSVHTFASAEDYLQSNHVEDTSCLITDVQMPGMNGIELQSLSHEQGCRTPIIFIHGVPRGASRHNNQLMR
jgi:FixJ family two-component response regulator